MKRTRLECRAAVVWPFTVRLMTHLHGALLHGCFLFLPLALIDSYNTVFCSHRLRADKTSGISACESEAQSELSGSQKVRVQESWQSGVGANVGERGEELGRDFRGCLQLSLRSS